MKQEKITPQELADRFEGYVAMDKSKEWYFYVEIPQLSNRFHEWHPNGDTVTFLNPLFNIQWGGNYDNSLHCPKVNYQDNELILAWNDNMTYVDIVRYRSYADNPKNNIIAHSNDSNYNKSYQYHRPFDEYLAKTPIEDWVK